MKILFIERAIYSFNAGSVIRGVRKSCFILIFMLSQLLSKARAQPVMDYGVQANIIYRITKYIEWPGNKKTGDFIIGIVGNSPLVEALSVFISNKTVGNQNIIVKRFSSSLETYESHILFVSADENGSFKKISLHTTGSPILLITESDGLARKGACINFIIVADHIKLEINKNNIERRGLSIASELLKLGIIIK